MAEKICEELFGVRIPTHYQKTGRTLTEARHETVKELARLAEGTYVPFYGTWNSVPFFIWRDDFAWNYKIVDWPKNGQLKLEHLWGCGAATKDEAVKACLLHVAQQLYTVTDRKKNAEGYALLLENLPGKDIQEEFSSWCKWQDEYRQLRDDGYNDDDARHILGGLTHLVPSYKA